jgi:hypothetical protein
MDIERGMDMRTARVSERCRATVEKPRQTIRERVDRTDRYHLA